MDLHDRCDAVCDRESFLDFVLALVEDREDEVAKEKISPSSPYGPGANGWENSTIEHYLESTVACARDSGFLPEAPSWQAFAQFLLMGKGYE